MGRLGYVLMGLMLLASSCKIYFGTYVDTYDDVLGDVKGVWRLTNPRDFEEGTLIFSSVEIIEPTTNFLDLGEDINQKFVFSVGRETTRLVERKGPIRCANPLPPKFTVAYVYEPWKEITGNWELVGRGPEYHMVLDTQNGKLIFAVKEYSRDELILHLVSQDGGNGKLL